MTAAQVAPSRREALLHHQRQSLRSLADESMADEYQPTATVIDTDKKIDDLRVAVSSKAPSECQVVSESCEWCLLPTPWTDDDGVSPDPFEVVGAPRFFMAPPSMKNGRILASTLEKSRLAASTLPNAVSRDDDDDKTNKSVREMS